MDLQSIQDALHRFAESGGMATHELVAAASGLRQALQAARVELAIVAWPCLESGPEAPCVVFRVAEDPAASPPVGGTERREASILELGSLRVDLRNPGPLKSRAKDATGSDDLGEIQLFFSDGGGCLIAAVECLVPVRRANVAAREALHAALQPSLRNTSLALSTQEFQRAYRSRLTFAETVLSLKEYRPSDTIVGLADKWLDASQCDWVWVWAFNRITRVWELICSRSSEAPAPLPARFSHSAASGIATWCWKHGRPAILVRPDWSDTVEGVEYRIACAEDLLALGCASLDCIPLVQYREAKAEASRPADLRQTVVVLHWRSHPRRIYHPARALGLMSGVTAHAIADSLTRFRSRLAERLSVLSTNAILEQSKNPQDVWRDFFKELLALIKEWLEVKYCSIFYRLTADDAIRCVSSSGLWRQSQDAPLSEQEWEAATYPADSDHLTSQVFTTGAPYINQIGQGRSDDAWLYSETPPGIRDADVSLAIFPIHVRVSKDSILKCGVIRCASVASRLRGANEDERNFDDFDASLLEFICREVGAAAESILASMKRETAMHAVKHDLQGPLGGIRDISHRYVRRYKRGPNRSKTEKLAEVLTGGEQTSLVPAVVLRQIATFSEGFRRTILLAAQDVATGPVPIRRLGDSVVAAAGRLTATLSGEGETTLRELPRMLEEFEDSIDVLASLIPRRRQRHSASESALWSGVATLRRDAEALRDQIASWLLCRGQMSVLVAWNDIENIFRESGACLETVMRVDLELDELGRFRREPTLMAGDIIARVMNSLAFFAQVYKVTLRLDMESFKRHMPELLLDRALVQRAIANVLVNAIKYSYPGGKVGITCRSEGDAAVVDITNEGIGIPEAELERVFQPRYRSALAKELGIPGDGLGLGIAREILRKHRGDLVVTRGRGPTCLSFIFPRSLQLGRNF